MKTSIAEKVPASTPVNELKKMFEKDGYLVISGGIPKDVLKAFQLSVSDLFDLARKNKKENIHDIVKRLDKDDKETLYLYHQMIQKMSGFDAMKAHFLSYAKKLLPYDTYLYIESGVLFGLPDDKRLTYDWHQETSFMPGIPNILNFWFPVFGNAVKENGTMSCLRKSHKLGPLPYTKHRIANNAFTSLVPDDAPNLEKKYEKVFFVTEPGDLVMLHNCVIHRSNNNQAQDVRFSGVLRIGSLKELPDKKVFAPASTYADSKKVKK